MHCICLPKIYLIQSCLKELGKLEQKRVVVLARNQMSKIMIAASDVTVIVHALALTKNHSQTTNLKTLSVNSFTYDKH